MSEIIANRGDVDPYKNTKQQKTKRPHEVYIIVAWTVHTDTHMRLEKSLSPQLETHLHVDIYPDFDVGSIDELKVNVRTMKSNPSPLHRTLNDPSITRHSVPQSLSRTGDFLWSE